MAEYKGKKCAGCGCTDLEAVHVRTSAEFEFLKTGRKEVLALACTKCGLINLYVQR